MYEPAVFLDKNIVEPDFAVGQDPDQVPVDCRTVAVITLIIGLARGEVDRAVAAFDETLKLDPSFLQAYTAKGLVLERLGKPQEALDLYQSAAGINAQDPITTMLYRRSQEQLNYRELSAHQDRIDELISDLLQRYRETPLPMEPQDEWSSRPLHLVFVDLETKGYSSASTDVRFLNERIREVSFLY